MGEQKMVVRDHYVDSLKGLAALNIIMIHTVFYFSESYTLFRPDSLSLLLDVPFFFFLSGWGMALSKKISFEKALGSILKIYKSYLIFLVFFAVAEEMYSFFVAGHFIGVPIMLERLVRQMFFVSISGQNLTVVTDSIWFLPVYMMVIPIFVILLSATRKSENPKRYQLTILAVLGVILGNIWLGGELFNISIYTVFYGAFFLLGYLMKDIALKWWQLGMLEVATVGMLALVAWGTQVSLWDMQVLKFPPTIYYFLYSCILIWPAVYLKNKKTFLKNKGVLSRIGVNALLFFFCQGIATSMQPLVMDLLVGAWYLMLPVCYLVNLAITIVLVFVLWWVIWVADFILNFILLKFSKTLAAKL